MNDDELIGGLRLLADDDSAPAIEVDATEVITTVRGRTRRRRTLVAGAVGVAAVAIAVSMAGAAGPGVESAGDTYISTWHPGEVDRLAGQFARAHVLAPDAVITNQPRFVRDGPPFITDANGRNHQVMDYDMDVWIRDRYGVGHFSIFIGQPEDFPHIPDVVHVDSCAVDPNCTSHTLADGTRVHLSWAVPNLDRAGTWIAGMGAIRPDGTAVVVNADNTNGDEVTAIRSAPTLTVDQLMAYALAFDY